VTTLVEGFVNQTQLWIPLQQYRVLTHALITE